MAQLTVLDLLGHGERLGLSHCAGPADERAVARVDVRPLDLLSTMPADTLVIVPGEAHPAPYRLDVALRQASARRLAGLVFTTTLALPETAVALAKRGG